MPRKPTKQELSAAGRLFYYGMAPSFFHAAGGKARAKSLSPERRSEIACMASMARTMQYVNGEKKRKGKPQGLAIILEAEKQALKAVDGGKR
jgi:hypothetical protein